MKAPKVSLSRRLGSRELRFYSGFPLRTHGCKRPTERKQRRFPRERLLSPLGHRERAERQDTSESAGDGDRDRPDFRDRSQLALARSCLDLSCFFGQITSRVGRGVAFLPACLPPLRCIFRSNIAFFN